MTQADEALELARTVADACLGTRVARLHRIVSRRYEQALRRVGLTLQQLELLTALTLAGGPRSPAELAAALGVERSTTSRNVTVLHERGLLRPSTTSTTGRTMAVVVAPAGLAALADAREAWRGAQADVAAALGPDASAQLDAWLDRLGA